MMSDLPKDFPSRARGVLLGAAVGDALGWPQEQRSSIIGGQRAREVEPQPEFRDWIRYGGSQFARYADPVPAGTYSDDTQLLAAVARSLLAGRWWEHLTSVELPSWLVYQRGGGGATLRACRSWSRDSSPWDADESGRTAKELGSYFRAGGNGVAMRVAPHALWNPRAPMEDLVARVVLDGISTHGHPRALVGAAAYAVAVRLLVTQTSTLGFGDLVTRLAEHGAWRDPDVAAANLPQEWRAAAKAAGSASWEHGWHETVKETLDMLRVAESALSQGSLASDAQTLETIGTFDSKRNGAGTVTAVGAVYLTARAAARPMGGLLRAAYLRNADTDTLASMTGALSGALHGLEWLGGLAKTVQDSTYLAGLADALIRAEESNSSGGPESRHAAPRDLLLRDATDSVRSSDVARWKKALKSGEVTSFVDGRPALLKGHIDLESKSPKSTVTRYLIDVSGQSVAVDITERVSGEPTRSATEAVDVGAGGRSDATASADSSWQRPHVATMAPAGRHGADGLVNQVAMLVPDVTAVQHFYDAIVGLRTSRPNDDEVIVADVLSFRRNRTGLVAGPCLIEVAVPSPQSVLERAQAADVDGARSLSPSSEVLRLKDPAGNDVQIRKAPPQLGL